MEHAAMFDTSQKGYLSPDIPIQLIQVTVVTIVRFKQ